MTDIVAEPQGASDGQKPRDWLDQHNAESPSVSADAVEEADDLASERASEPLAGPPPGIIKGIVYW